MLAQLLQSLYICTVFTHVNSEVIQTDGSDPHLISICNFYLSENLPCVSSAGLKWNKPIGRAVATARVCDHHLSARGVSYITNRHSLIYSSWIRSDFIWYIHWIKTQMPLHRKLRAVVLIYKLMAQIFTVQPTQLERFLSHFIDLYKNSCSAVKPFV